MGPSTSNVVDARWPSEAQRAQTRQAANSRSTCSISTSSGSQGGPSAEFRSALPRTAGAASNLHSTQARRHAGTRATRHRPFDVVQVMLHPWHARVRGGPLQMFLGSEVCVRSHRTCSRCSIQKVWKFSRLGRVPSAHSRLLLSTYMWKRKCGTMIFEQHLSVGPLNETFDRCPMFCGRTRKR